MSNNTNLTQAQIGNSKHIFILSYSGFNILMNIIENIPPSIIEDINKMIFCKDNFFIIEPFSRKEDVFLSLLTPIINELHLTIEKQKYVSGYFIDAYIPEINLALEYDEKGHLYYNQSNEINRQSIITNELNCVFLRVTDEYEISVALAKTIKKIFKLMKGEKWINI